MAGTAVYTKILGYLQWRREARIGATEQRTETATQLTTVQDQQE
jgi:hypothetical protein